MGVTVGFTCLVASNGFEDLLGCTGVFKDVLEDVRGVVGSVVDGEVFKDA